VHQKNADFWRTLAMHARFIYPSSLFSNYKSPMIDFSCIVGFENPHYYVLTFSFVFFPLGMAVYAPG